MQADGRPHGARPRRPARGAAGHLRDALCALAGGHAAVARHAETPWASITFAGARHRVELVFTGEPAIAAGEAFIEMLSEHEFAIPGQLVAEARVVEVDHCLSPAPRLAVACELLLLEDA